MLRLIKIILFCFAIPFSLLSQSYSFKKYSVNEGLSQPGIYCIAEDHLGNIWFGTEGGGVNVFDGQKMVTYDEGDGLSNNTVRTLFEDSKSRMWIGTSDGGLSLYEKGEFRSYNVKNGLPDDHIRSIVEDNDGNIWVGTLNGGLCILTDSVKIHYNTTNGLRSNTIRTLLKDHLGRIWVGTDDGLSLWQNGFFKHFTVLNGLPNNVILTSYLDKQNNIWVGTNKGAAIFNGSYFTNITKKNGLKNPRVRAICQDNNGDYWIGTKQGLSKLSLENYRKKNFKFKYYNESNGLSNNRIRDIFQDSSGSIWIATHFGGVNQFLGEKFTTYNVYDGLGGSEITSVYHGKDSSLYFGTFSNGITKFVGKRFRYFDEKHGVPSAEITNITEDINNNLWIGTATDGIVIFDQTTQKTTRLDKYNFLGSNEITTILNGPNNSIIVGSNGGGIDVFCDVNNYEEDIINITTEEGLPTNHISDIHINQHGQIVFSTEKLVGQFELNNCLGNSDITTIIDLDTLINSEINCFQIDANNNIWIGTNGNGIFIYNTTLHSVDKSVGLSDNHINFIHFEPNEIVIVGTNKGIDEIKVDGNLNIESITNYGSNQGFLGIKTTKKAFAKDAFNNLWAGTINGVSRVKINSSSLTSTLYHPQISITGLLSDYKKIDWSPYANELKGEFNLPEGLILPHNKNNISFEFFANCPIDPQNTEYKFQLKGPITIESPIKKERIIHFPNLEPGDYTFNVYARLKGHPWTPNPATFEFTIRKPLWQQWWFIVSVLAIIALIIYSTISYRTKKLVREKQKLEKLVMERTTDLEAEKQKSESLLLNILPEEIAEELKTLGVAKTKLYQSATVLFTDFKGFTKLSGQLTPEELVNELDQIFAKFDAITDEHNLEKIKTIGDAYMCCGGIPVENNTHALNGVLAAFQFIEQLKLFNAEHSDHDWQVRVGLHTGPIIAGVVGKKKFAYDIWGDTVNIASRMESNGEIEKVNISEVTYDLVKDYFECEPRGKIEVKNKGLMTMFYVDRIKPRYSADLEGMVPNTDFLDLIEEFSKKDNLSEADESPIIEE